MLKSFLRAAVPFTLTTAIVCGAFALSGAPLWVGAVVVAVYWVI